jgi:flagellar motor switch protein FliM
MGIRKISARSLANLDNSKKELSIFWNTYFSSLSASLTKLFFKHTQEQVSVRFVHRDIVKVKDYFDHLNEVSVVHSFRIQPHNEIGFLHLNDDLSNWMINTVLGGSDSQLDLSHQITETDLALLDSFLTEMMDTLLKQFQDENRQVDFDVIDEDLHLLKISQLHAEQLISIQQFSLSTPSHTFVFDIAFSSRVLDSFSLV